MCFWFRCSITYASFDQTYNWLVLLEYSFMPATWPLIWALLLIYYIIITWMQVWTECHESVTAIISNYGSYQCVNVCLFSACFLIDNHGYVIGHPRWYHSSTHENHHDHGHIHIARIVSCNSSTCEIDIDNLIVHVVSFS